MKLKSLFRKAFRRGFCCEIFSIDELISAGDKKFFCKMSDVRHCLHALVSKQRHDKIRNSLTSLGHNYVLPQIEMTLFKISFLTRCLFSYISVFGITLCASFCLLLRFWFFTVCCLCPFLLCNTCVCYANLLTY